MRFGLHRLMQETITLSFCGIAATMAYPSAAAATLQGDCDDNGTVAIFEVQRCVNIFLSPPLLSQCFPCDQNGDASVDIAEVQGAANCFSNPAGAGCLMVIPQPTVAPTVTLTPQPTATVPPIPTDTPTSMPTHTPANTPTATAPAPTATATQGTAVCGNGMVEPPETCDDGNTNTADACPPDCILRGCTPDGTMRAVDVRFAAPMNLISITVFVEYPDGTLQIPGTGTNASVGQRVINRPGGFLATFVDADYGLRGTLSGGSPLTNPRLFTINFDRCTDAPAAVVDDFNCTVIEAVNQSFQNVPGTTCSVTLP